MAQRIVVVGSINMDMVTTVKRMPTGGETVHGTSFAMVPGGKGANQAVAAARLGGNVALIAQLGRDAFAAPLRTSLEIAGVNTQWVRASPGPCGCATILVDDAGTNSIVVVAGANDRLQPADVDAAAEVLAGAAIFLAQLETPLDTVLHVSRVARRLGVPFMLDPAPARQLPQELLQNTTWLTPNETECVTLLRGTRLDGVSLTRQNASAAAEQLLKTGVRNVALKMGEQGVFLAGRDIDESFLPAFRVDAVDTTAAGDAFNGGFAWALAEGKPPAEAARFAAAVAAVSVTRRGAQTSLPARAEAESLLATG